METTTARPIPTGRDFIERFHVVMGVYDDMHRERVRAHEKHAPKDDLPPFPWFLGAGRNIKAPTGEPAWLSELSPVWIRIVERMNRYGMTRYGYKPARLDPRPGLFARMGARLKELPEVFRSIGRMARFARLCRQKELADPQVAMQALLSINPGAWKRYPDFKIPRVPGPADL